MPAIAGVLTQPPPTRSPQSGARPRQPPLLKLDRDDGGLLVQLATNFGFQSGGGTIWGLNPFMTLDTNYVTFGLGFGATFPMAKK